MSLINDALKRAKQAQLDAPRATISGLHLRPVEPSQGLRQRIGLMLPAITLVAITLAALVGWRVFLRSNSAKSPSHISPSVASDLAARPAEELVAKAAPAVNEAQPQPASAPPAGVEPPAAASGSSTPASTPGTLPGATIPSATGGAVADSPVPAETPPAPKPAPLKLQGILFDPAHPAAMISGRTLFIGDKLGEWRVVSISQESATLVNAGQTNFLALPQ